MELSELMDRVNNGGKEPNGREITYQVGWKRGTIRHKDGEQDGSFPVGTWAALWAERMLWRPLPLPGLPAGWMQIVLWAVPVVSFALTYILVKALMSANSF